jgi:hypothetical protein
MQKRTIYYSLLIFISTAVTFACKKNSDNTNNTGKTKTELITSSSWKFDNAKLGPADVSSFIDDCEKDNTVTFVSNMTGTVDEGATKCNSADPQTVPFTWAFENSETSLHTSTPLFPGNGDFAISTLNDTQLSVSRDTVVLGITQTFTINLKH